MTFDTLKHVQAMQETALALEEQARSAGLYTKDCSRVHDAIARGRKSGFACLFDERGEMEIIPLNAKDTDIQLEKGNEEGHWNIRYGESSFEGWKNCGPSKTHTENPQPMGIEGTLAYTPVTEKSFPAIASESHKRENATKGRFDPVQTADAARRKAAMDATKERSIRAAGIQRSERIFAAMKERSAQIHK